MTDLDTLRPEVRKAVQELDGKAYPGSRTHEHWLTIRDELLRLACECAMIPRAQLLANFAAANERAEKAEAELAALKARIAVAPVVTCPKTLVHAGNTMQTEFLEYTHECIPGGCNRWAGKRVRLVVEE